MDIEKGGEDVSYNRDENTAADQTGNTTMRLRYEDICTELMVNSIPEKIQHSEYPWYVHLHWIKEQTQVKQVWKM